MAIQIKTLDQLKSMRQANLLVRSTLELVRANIKAGITTSALDAIAEANIKRGGGTSNFKGYHGYPAVICVSVNDEIDDLSYFSISDQRSIEKIEGELIIYPCRELLITTLAITSLFNSRTIRIDSSDSFLASLIPSSFFSSTNSATRLINSSGFTL